MDGSAWIGWQEEQKGNGGKGKEGEQRRIEEGNNMHNIQDRLSPWYCVQRSLPSALVSKIEQGHIAAKLFKHSVHDFSTLFYFTL